MKSLFDERIVRWLHLSDPRCPAPGDAPWEDALAGAIEPIGAAPDVWGPIDFVLISGGLTASGCPREYERLASLCDVIRARLSRDGREPFVLATPGASDLCAGGADAWTRWWEQAVRALPSSVVLRNGGRAGDFVATVTFMERGLRVGVVGIGPGAADASARIRSLCEDGPERWFGEHHVALALTHEAVLPEAPREAPLTLPTSWQAFVGCGLKALHAGCFKGQGEAVSVRDGGGVLVAQVKSLSGAEGDGNRRTLWGAPGGVAVEFAGHPADRALLRAWDCPLGRGERPTARSPRFAHSFDVSKVAAPPVALTRGGVEALLDDVLPEEADIDSFVRDQIRKIYDDFHWRMDRRQRVRRLLDMMEPSAVVEALTRYLPESTAEGLARVRASGRG